jgi:Pyridine nucleotide-disulphide oxidoreductase/NADH:flavin oxidoreductase / NADH oxidase family
VATATLFMIEASMHVPPGYAMFIPAALRQAVDLPVVGVGRFKDPLQAERALEQGHCDLVGVVRGQIADADFAAKARAGHTEDIRLCLSCNQECVGRMGLNRWLGCIENPRTGREATPPPRRASRHLRVVVVGAGPAGLEAATTAAERGHQVTVYERADAPGGQVRLAATVPSRAELGDLVRNQVAACRRLGVEVNYGVTVDAGQVRRLAPDAVVVATGARPGRPPWVPPAGGRPDGATPQVADLREVLEGGVRPSGRVLVVDELGFHQATSVAELLADRGCQVEVVASGMVVGQDLGVTLDMETWCTRASAKGITQTPDTVVMGLEDGTVTLLHHPSGRAGPRLADWVVLATPWQPREELYFQLKHLREEGVRVERAGDCVAPRRAHAAVIEGHRIGATL